MAYPHLIILGHGLHGRRRPPPALALRLARLQPRDGVRPMRERTQQQLIVHERETERGLVEGARTRMVRFACMQREESKVKNRDVEITVVELLMQIQ